MKHALAVFAVFFATTTVAAQSPEGAARGTLTVRSVNGTVTLAPSDLAPHARVQVRLPSENAGDSTTVAGILLWDVLQRVGVPSAQASGRQRAVMSVVLKGRDGQRAVIALVEIDPRFSSEVILLAETRNGRPLNGDEGAWRAILPADRRHARWIRDVVDIEVVSLP